MKMLLILICLLFVNVSGVYAVTNPTGVPNNRVGVHILDTPEIGEAAKLINSSGGDWGYVTIPIRSNDRGIEKWTRFMQDAKRLHVIPLLRIATYPQEGVWATPTAYDLVDFANFFDTLPWPTKNRYVILFNEPNHASEWGGDVAPNEYATLLIEANNIFKAHSQDYFLVTGGLDMSLPNSTSSLEALEYYRRMTLAQPDWFKYVDGFSMHAYPNPGFSAFPWSFSRFGISSYRYELAYLNSLKLSRSPALPIFITETGWVDDLGSKYYKTSLDVYWNDPQIIAITPFVLFAGNSDFSKFSLLTPDHRPTGSYQEIFKYPKIAGSPLLANIYIAPATSASFTIEAPPQSKPFSIFDKAKSFFNSLFMVNKSTRVLELGSVNLNIEIADTDKLRVQGLSGRNNLPANTGMLFMFPESSRQAFWMKDMKFDLDFVWINQGRVVQIHESVLSPDKTGGVPKIINPDVNIDMVLEVLAGFVSQNKIQVGDKVVLR